jgi:hypothetical protein
MVLDGHGLILYVLSEIAINLYDESDTNSPLLGLRHPIRQADPDGLEIHPSSLCQFQEAVHRRVVHHTAVAGLQRRHLEHAPAAH